MASCLHKGAAQARSTAWGLAALVLLLFWLTGCASEPVKVAAPLPEAKEAPVCGPYKDEGLGFPDKTGAAQWTYTITDDNRDTGLPQRWRSWWFIRIDGVPVDRPSSVHVLNYGWPFRYLPVYSYDRKTWQYFSEQEVTLSSDRRLVIHKRFDKPIVWVARFYPYTLDDLSCFLNSLRDNPYIKIEPIGQTAQGREIPMITVTDFTVKPEGKKRVWIHTRTHPGETGGSYVVEGLVHFLSGDDETARKARAGLIFSIVPMHNMDGVAAGNYRTTPDSCNLETAWYYDPFDPVRLAPTAPKEVTVLHDTILRLTQEGPPMTIALNLHSSNGEAGTKSFFITHFGPQERGYSEEETSLWGKQLQFINYLAYYFGPELFEPIPPEGGHKFLRHSYPETWWWQSFKDAVMALTIETTYGKSGPGPRWVKQEDLRELGKAMVKACMLYNGIDAGTGKTNGSPKDAMRLFGGSYSGKDVNIDR